MRQEFEAKLMGKGPGGAWTYLAIPFDVSQLFGMKARVPVAGTLNGFPFRNSLMHEGDGTHSTMVSKELQRGAQARAGDVVTISLELDLAERDISPPQELAAALVNNEKAAVVFGGLTHSQKKEYVDWINSAKQTATKASRVTKAVEMLTAGKKRLRWITWRPRNPLDSPPQNQSSRSWTVLITGVVRFRIHQSDRAKLIAANESGP